MRLDGLLDVWGGGQLLAFSGLDGPTRFATGLVGRTAPSGAAIEIKLPGDARLLFDEEPPMQCLLAGDFFEIVTRSGRARGAFVDCHHLLVEGRCSVEDASGGLLSIVSSGEGEAKRVLVGAADAFRPEALATDLAGSLRARRRWLESIDLPEGLSDAQRRTAVKALSQVKTQIYAPEGRITHRWSTPDRWPHRKMWLWDSVFHAIGIRRLDPLLAREVISAVLDCQRPDGFISHMMDPQGGSAITQPPLLALGTLAVHETSPNLPWLEQIYPKLERYLAWDQANRDSDGEGLVEWSIDENPLSRSGESGMDNSPRFDEPGRLDAVDFNAFLARDFEALSALARALGREEAAEEHTKRHDRLCVLINERLWDEETGLYLDCDLDTHLRRRVLASAGFLPLLAGVPSQRQAERMAAHLLDPATFGAPLPIASIAANDREHYRKDMWRGPVWANINWLVAEGFARYGLFDAADRIRSRTLAEIERQYLRHGTFFEFYDDRCEVDPPALDRKGSCDPSNPYHQVVHDYGWTATIYLDLVLR